MFRKILSFSVGLTFLFLHLFCSGISTFSICNIRHRLLLCTQCSAFFFYMCVCLSVYTWLWYCKLCLGECEIRSTMSSASPLATYPVGPKARFYWFACFSSSISSRCSSESAARPAQCRRMADIFISCLVQQACVRGQTVGAGVISLDWMCCGGLARHRWTFWEYGHNVQSQFVYNCPSICVYVRKAFVHLNMVNVEKTRAC